MRNTVFSRSVFGSSFGARGVYRSDTSVDPVLKRAVAAWKADRYDSTLDALVDLTGNGHHARFGSTVGADTNDPLPLPFDGEKYLYLPGTAGNYASTPDSSALDITGDLDLRVLVAPTDWTPESTVSLIGKWNLPGDQRAYRLILNASGFPELQWTVTGATPISSATATSQVSFPDGTPGWLRGTLDVDNGSSQWVVTFYTSLDGVAWTPLGTPVSAAGSTSIAVTTGALAVGAYGAGEGDLVSGRIYRAQVWDGIEGEGGVLVADFDASHSAEPHTSFVAATGGTWTIHRSESGRKAVLVDRTLLLFGTDDYLTVPNHDDLNFGVGQHLTAVAAFRRYGASVTANQIILGKRNSFGTAPGDNGYQIWAQPTGSLLRAGVLADVPASALGIDLNEINGFSALFALLRDDDRVALYHNASFVNADNTEGFKGSLENTQSLRIGRFGLAEEYADMEFIGAAVFREALTEADLTRLSHEFGVQ